MGGNSPKLNERENPSFLRYWCRRERLSQEEPGRVSYRAECMEQSSIHRAASVYTRMCHHRIWGSFAVFSSCPTASNTGWAHSDDLWSRRLFLSLRVMKIAGCKRTGCSVPVVLREWGDRKIYWIKHVS